MSRLPYPAAGSTLERSQDYPDDRNFFSAGPNEQEDEEDEEEDELDRAADDERLGETDEDADENA